MAASDGSSALGAPAAAVPTSAVSHFSSMAQKHPPYEDMILRAIETLKSRKGSSWRAISKYITDNYSDLPPTHSALLTEHLRSLNFKGVIRSRKFCYKLAFESKKLGRPPKPTSSGEPKKRSRPRKVQAFAAPADKKRPSRRPKAAGPATNGPVYIISQAEQFNYSLQQSFPGGVAIVLPKGLLNEKVAKNPILIFPKGIQSAIDASVGKLKSGRLKKTGIMKKRGRPRKKTVAPNWKNGGYGDGKGKPSNSTVGGPGRPWKIRDLLVPGKAEEILEKPVEPELPDGVLEGSKASGFVMKRRSVGRPRKRPLYQGSDTFSVPLFN